MERQIVGLVVVVLFLAITATLLNRENEAPNTQLAQLNISLLPENFFTIPKDSNKPETTLEQVKRMAIYQGDETLLDAFQLGEKWFTRHLSSKVPYPLQTRLLKELVSEVSKAKITEKKSGDPANHGRLGLLDYDADNSTSVLLDLASDKQDVQLLLGNDAQRAQGQYVRFRGDDQMLLIDKFIDTPIDIFAWLDTAIFDLDPNNVTTITRLYTADDLSESIKNIKQSYHWQISRTENNTLKLEGMNDKDNLVSETVLEDYLSSLVSLSFQQMKARDDTTSVFDVEGDLDSANEQAAIAQVLLSLEVETQDLVTSTRRLQRLRLLKTTDEELVVQIQGEGTQARFNEWQYVISQNQAEQLLKDKTQFLATSSQK